MARTQWRRFAATFVTLAALTMSVTACGDDDADAEAGTPNGGATTQTGTDDRDADADAETATDESAPADATSGADLDAFCAVAPDSSEEVPESYVGSDEHVDDLDQLRAEAPTELRADLDLVVGHFDDGVDPSEPDSQLAENFPDEVNAAIGRVVAYIDVNCAGSR